MPIRVLPEAVALRIAAGEVITRPTDAVKELVENAVDAVLASRPQALTPHSGGRLLAPSPAERAPGARQWKRGAEGGLSALPARIDVEIRDGGLALIRVVDTGCGIPADEVALAFQRHATSKLATAEDLFAVRTLGFRGEALASIAAISQVALYTRAAGAELGALLELDAGRVVEQGPRAGPVGTSITVRNLFQNVPARLRFLRSAAGEAGQVVHLVGQYALSFPEIRFSLLNDGRLVFQSPGGGRLEDVLAKVYGAALVEKLLPVEGEAGRLKVVGYVAEPGTHRSTRSGISIFVNRRWVQSRALTYAVEEAYQPALPAGRHPVAALWLELPPSEVDVNVHPTKAEVRFADERGIYAAVRRTIRGVVLRAAPVPGVGAPLAPAVPSPPGPAVESSPAAQVPRQASFAGAAGASGAPAEPGAPAAREPGLPILHPLGQVHRTYVVAEGPDGVYFVDQHTAHERVRYEEIQAQRAGAGVASQVLLDPLVVDLTPRQWGLLGEGAPSLRALGFAFEPLGERSVLLRAVPAMLRLSDLARAFTDVVDALATEGPAAGVDAPSAVLACHSAVRAGDALSPEEIRELLGRLEGLDVWRYCPHGRPIVIRLDAAQLARDFRRV